MYFSSVLLGLVAVTYIYAWPSPVAMEPLELPRQEEMVVASEPARQSFVSYSDEAKISAFWKSPEESRYSFTIVIDPNDAGASEARTDADEQTDPEEAEMDGNALPNAD